MVDMFLQPSTSLLPVALSPDEEFALSLGIDCAVLNANADENKGMATAGVTGQGHYTVVPPDIVHDTLIKFADMGDIQTAASLYLVLGHDALKDFIPRELAVEWFLAYHEQLHMFQLHNEATKV
jgi:hypothetical protein